MKKRQAKKLARWCCPRCRQEDGIWNWQQLRTGRWVSDILACWLCMEGQEAKQGDTNDPTK